MLVYITTSRVERQTEGGRQRARERERERRGGTVEQGRRSWRWERERGGRVADARQTLNILPAAIKSL